MTAVHSSAAATRILSGLLEARTGQQLSSARTWRIEASLRPMIQQLELSGLEALVAKIVRGKEPELASRVIEAMLNNETSFFRDAGVFDVLTGPVLDRIASERVATRRLRVWSAGCSTGQELYSIAIPIVGDAHRWRGWTIDLLGTDVSASTIARAVEGRYTPFEAQRGLPVRTMLKWFQQEGLDWVVDPQLQRAVRFMVHEIGAAAPGRFDLILCRNVLMYFPEARRRQVFDRLADALEPGGMLVIGAGETVIGQTDRFVTHPDIKGLYARSDDVRPSQRVATAR